LTTWLAEHLPSNVGISTTLAGYNNDPDAPIVDNFHQEFDDVQTDEMHCPSKSAGGIIMLDINKSIQDPARFENDPEGNMIELDSWSPLFANREAQLEGIELTENHWKIIYYLRERFRARGNNDPAREVLHDLEMNFGEVNGRGYLYQLFPHGPVGQASRIAGLPMPPHTTDRSFGTMM
jgi:tRNA 2-thiouridine synthesizing protein E